MTTRNNPSSPFPSTTVAPYVEDSDVRAFLDANDPDLVLAAFRDAAGGPAHMRRIGAMARALLRTGARPKRVLDVCSGAGDLGRTLGLLEAGCTVDFVDRDRFALAVAGRINRRRNVTGRLIERDLWDDDWAAGLPTDYDVIACSHGLSSLDEERMGEVLVDFSRRLRQGGRLLLAESTAGAADDHRQDHRWNAFFHRLERLVGAGGRRTLVSSVPPGRHPIEGEALPVRTFLRALAGAGFSQTEVIDRSNGEVSILSAWDLWASQAA